MLPEQFLFRIIIDLSHGFLFGYVIYTNDEYYLIKSMVGVYSTS